MTFEPFAVLTACLATIASVSCVLLVRFFKLKRWEVIPLFVVIFILTFFLANKLTLVTMKFAESYPPKTSMDSLEPLQEFPYLGISLSLPIENLHYRIDGEVPSVSYHEQKVFAEFGYPLIESIEKTDDYGSIRGNCLILGTRFEKTAVTMWLPGDPEQNLFTAIHEEMHVAQNFKVTEVFENLKSRFDILGFAVEFEKFSMEQQADLAAILIFLEKGYSLEKISKTVGIDAGNAIKKLQAQKKI